MTMKPYYEFTKEKGNRENGLGVIFNNGVTAMIIDYYCINPDCPCTDVTLAFIENDENQKPKAGLFTLLMDTRTWKIKKKTIANKILNCKRLIDEFSDGLDEGLKETFRKRAAEAKIYGRENPLECLDFDKMGLKEGACVGYAEVFGEKDNDKFIFDYQGTQYFVDDQYCTSPNCKCNEAILTFVEMKPAKKTASPCFAVRMSVGAGRYKVEFNNLPQEEMQQVIQQFKEHQGKDPELLKRRYTQMKEFGKKCLERKRPIGSESQRIVEKKIGRNDPCPCGSGKKYKKCCGVGA